MRSGSGGAATAGRCMPDAGSLRASRNGSTCSFNPIAREGSHMKIRITRIAAALVAAMLVVPAVTAAATTSAGTVHLNGVRTTLTTDPATTGVLVSKGILPLPVGPATVAP